jgi:retron-type reverse transcriptase
MWDGFSKHSHGFRPGRRAHDAIVEAQRNIQEGRRWVVDVDLEEFFDRVNQDVLMGRLAKRIDDGRCLRLIRRYLEAGITCNPSGQAGACWGCCGGSTQVFGSESTNRRRGRVGL